MKFLGRARVSQLVIVIFFALNCVFPSRALLSLQNCGEHEIVSCQVHDDQHFVALHASSGEANAESAEQKVSFAGQELPEEHDAAHQIEEVKLAISSVELASTNITKIIYTVTSGVVTTQPAPLFNSNSISNNVELINNSFLSSLPSVRLQV